MDWDLWIEIGRLILSLFSIIILPLGGILFRQIRHIENRFQEMMDLINNLQKRSDMRDEELSKNWLHFYNNEIIRFTERVKTKPEHIPTQEHYKSVFDNYKRYKELGGNTYIDVIMDNVKVLFKIHYGFDIEELNKKK